MLPLVLNVRKVARRDKHFVAYFLAALLAPCPRRLYCQPPLSQQEKGIGREQPNNALTPNRETESKAQTAENKMPQIPPKPVMSAEAASYPKLLKIYQELNRQNGIIFDAERERNALELERDSLKGLAKLTKKGASCIIQV